MSEFEYSNFVADHEAGQSLQLIDTMDNDSTYTRETILAKDLLLSIYRFC